MPGRSHPAPAPARPWRTRPTRRDPRRRSAFAGQSHISAYSGVSTDDGSRGRDTAVRALLRGATGRDLRLSRACWARRRRGCVPGDVPQGPSRLREARARPAPAGLGVPDRDERRGRRAAAVGSDRGARRDPVTDERPAYAELEHLVGELPPTERAAVVLRYGYDLSYDDIGAALGSSAEAARAAASSGVRRLRRRHS